MVAYNLVDDEVVIEGKEGRIRWAISREFIEVVVRSHNCRIIDICEIDSEDSFIHEGLDCEELNIRPPFISHYFVGLFWKFLKTPNPMKNLPLPNPKTKIKIKNLWELSLLLKNSSFLKQMK